MNTVKLGLAGWISLVLVNIFLWAPLIVIAMLGFSDANSMTFPPPAYSLRWLHTLVTDPEWTSAIKTSMSIGALTVILSLVLGIPLGLGIARGKIGRSVALQALVAAPLILPAISLAIGFYFVAAKLMILDSLLPLILAHTTVGISFVVVTVVAAARSIDVSLEPAARTLGASFFRSIWDVTLPMISVGVIGGAALAFLHSWDDVVNALMLGTARFQPFPQKIWSEMQHVLNPMAAAAAVLLSIVGIGILGFAGLFVAIRKSRVPKEQVQNVILRNGAS